METKKKLIVGGCLVAIIAVMVFFLYRDLNNFAYGAKEETVNKPTNVMTYTTSASLFMCGSIDNDSYDYSKVEAMLTNYDLSFINNEFNVESSTGEVEGVRYQVLVIEDTQKDIDAISVEGYDLTVVAIKWNEADDTISDHQKEVAQQLADKNVSVVIGVGDEVAPMEWVDDTAIFYSLGKAAGDEGNVGMIASIRVTKSIAGDWIENEVSQAKADLIYTDENNTLIPFSQLLNQGDKYQKIYEEYTNHIGSLTDNLRFGGLE